MTSFRNRSYEKELLDSSNIPFNDIKRNMKELDIINKRLGGHDITLDGIVRLVQDSIRFNEEWHILEVGCGGGDNLRAVKEWAEHIKLPVHLTGVDINPDCITYARQQPSNNGIEFLHMDYKATKFPTKPEIIFSSLFCHHFTDPELVYMIQWMRENSYTGFFINDLHRHPLAYYSIKLLTTFFSKSYLVKNDAPLSVKRGFSKDDWVRLFHKAGIEHFQIEWRWAFRWLILSVNNE